MDDHTQRVLQWTRPSHKLHPAGAMFLILVQALGRLDAELVFEVLADPPAGASQHEHFDYMERFNAHITSSYLWVLGAYELLRTLDQRAREQGVFDEFARDRIREVKERFNRVRVPLAKLEPARSHAETDRAFALPTFEEDLGVGWRIGRDKIVTRRELADAFLELLASLPELPESDTA